MLVSDGLLLKQLPPIFSTQVVGLLVVGDGSLASHEPGLQFWIILGQIDLFSGQNGTVGCNEGQIGDGHVTCSGDESGRLQEVPDPTEYFVQTFK